MSGVLDRAVADVGAGRPVVIQDGDGPGYLCFAAALATPALLAFAVRRTSGFVRVALTPADTQRLELPLMRRDSSAFGNPYTVAFDASAGVSTGISAADRARTIALAGSPESCPDDLSRPGHVIGVCVDDRFAPARIEFARAALRLVEFAGSHPAAGLCELVDASGELIYGRELAAWSQAEGLTLVPAATVPANHDKFVGTPASWSGGTRIPA